MADISGAELATRITAARAVLADYQRAAVTADVAERAMWGAQLADMLASVLDAPAPSLDGLEPIVRQAFRDAIQYQESTQKRGWRGQVALYREAARLGGIEIGRLRGRGRRVELTAEQLATLGQALADAIDLPRGRGV